MAQAGAVNGHGACAAEETAGATRAITRARNTELLV